MEKLPLSVVVLGLGVLAFVAFLYVKSPEIKEKRAQAEEERAERQAATQARDECLELENRIVQGRLQGADLTQAAQAEASFRQCLERTRADELFRAPLVIAKAMHAHVRQEWAHYVSTADSDAVKRNGTRGTILRVAADFVVQVREATNLATRAEQLDQIEQVAREWESDARARALCWLTSGGGCSRFGENEPSGGARANDDFDKSVTPLIGGVAATAQLQEWGLNPSYARTVGAGLYAEIAAKRAELSANWRRAAQGSIGAALAQRGGLVFRIT